MTPKKAFLPGVLPLIALAIALFPISHAAAQDAAGSAIKSSPKPSYQKAETDYLAKLDSLLAPVKAYAPSADDAQRIKDAVTAVKSNGMARFEDIKSGISDPAGQKLVEWVRLRAGYGRAEEYRAFLDANPLWPDRAMMVQRLEEALFTQGGSAQSIKAHFKSAEPQTGLGYAALASAYQAEGNMAEAKKLAAMARDENSGPP